MPDDSAHLLALLDVGQTAVGDFTGLCRELGDADWSLATDCPGWSVHDLLAHSAHLEAVLAGAPEETLAVPEGLPHVVGPMSVYTEQGVLARRGRRPAELIEELESSFAARAAETRAEPPTDAKALPPRTPGGVGWPWATLLNNRPVDLFSHEQDVRRAIGRPGNLDGPVARHVVETFARGLGFVLGRRVGAGAGTTALVELVDAPAEWSASYGVQVGDDGRGRPWTPDGTPDVTPDVTLQMSTESFLVLSGGRRAVADVPVEISGDDDLAARLLAAMATTP